MKKMIFSCVALCLMFAVSCSDDENNNHNTAANVEMQAISINGVTFNMVKIPGSTYTMGSENDSLAQANEMPAHSVTLSDYYIGELEVTQELWNAVLDSSNSYFSGSKLPVENITYSEAQTFLSTLSYLVGWNFRLPTEAEWEYAARGGENHLGHIYAGDNDPAKVAWYNANSNSQTHNTGSLNANEIGIYDMSGNVWEWCSDPYGPYSPDPQVNPYGDPEGSKAVLRGGSFTDPTGKCRVAARYSCLPDRTNRNIGMRIAADSGAFDKPPVLPDPEPEE